MKKGKLVGLWILSIFFILCALVYFPSFSSLVSVLIVALVIPISKWQAILNKYIKGKLKLIIVIILALLAIFTAPNTEAAVPVDTTSTITTEASIDPSIESTAETTTESTADSTTVPATEPTIKPATEPNTEPVTEVATEPVHTHKFKDATCVTPKTCACGATEGKAKGHSWKAATCKAPKTCKTCGETKGDLAEHDWKAATCEAPKTCKTCGTTSGSVGSHKYSNGKCKTCGKADPTASTTKPTASTSDGDPDNDDTSGKTVYKTPTGKRYHIDPNCGGKNSTKTTLAKAKAAGLTPCKTCVK